MIDMKKGLCPLCRLLLFFLFRIILLFLLIRLLNQIRNIDCKDWEHHHSQSCQQYGEYPSGSRDQRIHFMFKDKEGKAGEIDRCQQHRQIGDEQAGSPVVGEPAHYDGQCVSPSQQRNKAEQVSDFGRKGPPVIRNDVLIRDRHSSTKSNRNQMQIHNWIFMYEDCV